MKKYLCCFIAPAAVLCILLPVFYFYGMYPFGDKTLAWCDMEQQVIPFLMDFKDILSGKANMFLNLQNAGGMSFWGVFLFFISSPFTFLVAFVEKAKMYHFVNVLVLLKMMVCSFTASIFFRRQFKKLEPLQIAALSVMYAFCGYTMFYYQNQVWLDVMYLFPILLIGLSKLVEKEQIWLYVVAFSAILTVNFYLSYMVSVFLVLSFGVYVLVVSPRERRRKNILLLGISTLLVALITAVIWLPSLMQYLSSARTGNFISSLKTGSFFTRFNTAVAVMLCTGAILAAVIMYFLFTPKFSKQGIFTLCVFILTIIPVFIEPINKMWHTGNYQAFPVRYGYITVFFGLVLLAIVISNMNDRRLPERADPLSLSGGSLAVIALLFVSWILISKEYEAITVYTRTLWGDSKSFKLLLLYFFVAAFSYLIIMLLYQLKKLNKTAFSVFLCMIAVIESVFNSCVYIASPSNHAEKYKSVISLSNKISDSELYRVKTNEKYYDVNLTGSLGYNTLSHYTSLTNESFMYAMKKLGYSSYWMEVNSNGGTEFTDAILGNRYSIIKNSEQKNTDKIIYENAKYAIKKNDITLPIGFIMNTNQIKSLKNLPDTTRFNIQQSLFQSVFHTADQLMTNYEPSSLDNISINKDRNYTVTFPDDSMNGIITYNIPVKGTQTLYFDCFDKLSNSLIEHINSSFSLFVNGELIQMDYPSQSNNGLVNLGTFTDQTVMIQIEVRKEVSAKSFGIAGLNIDTLNNAVSKTTTAKMKQVNNQIVGSATADSDDAYLFLPLTYDSGYTASVNNKSAEVFKVFDCMLAVKLQKGSNTISVRYLPPGMQTGAYLSVVGILLLIVTLISLKRGLYRKIRFLEIPASIAFASLFIGIFIAVYVFPIIVYFR